MEFETKIFSPVSRPISSPFWLKIMPKSGFLIFLIFLLFFSEFYCPGRVWAEFGTKFFLSISQPISSVLAKNNARKRFFHFLNFFAVIFGIFFLGLPNPNLAKNKARKIFFFNFWIFLQFFSEFSCPGRLWTEFGTKIFLSLSLPISSRFH